MLSYYLVYLPDHGVAIHFRVFAVDVAANELLNDDYGAVVGLDFVDGGHEATRCLHFVAVCVARRRLQMQIEAKGCTTARKLVVVLGIFDYLLIGDNEMIKCLNRERERK